ncbi:hypothetical protein [Acidovorax sp.]|uniref:hypothetical protein n=1 Tax=Acidovorax sp. TaxID=1872122 RepID=UPI00391944B3
MTNTDMSREREDFEAWALSQKLGEYTEQMGFRFFDAGDGYPSWRAWQARASLAASAPAPSAHIKEPYTLAEIKAKIASNDYSAEMLLQHAMLLLDSAYLSANAGEPVAHLWQHCETGRTRIVMPDMIVDADASWQVVGPLYLGAAPPTAQAEGWRLVPVEPTLAMGWAYLDAARESEPGKTHTFNYAGYRAMIAAAPPASEAKGA